MTRIAMIALGKIGLPLAVQFATMGHEVLGADVDAATVARVNEGIAPFPGEEGLGDRLAKVVADGRLRATTDTRKAVARSQVVVVAVPLFVDDQSRPDFSLMDAATAAIAAGLQRGTLVSYETTLPVGTTRTRYAPMLGQGSGLVPGVDFHLVFSPERVLTGRVFADLRRYPKLVGGIDGASEAAGMAFYASALTFDDRRDLPRPNGVWAMGSAEAAELAKLAETTYRDVNIGLANQFARFADANGIDLTAVIEACNSQPYSRIHTPGIAVGGHCIPVYPRLYLFNDPEATIVAAAREANAGMPAYAVGRLAQAYGDLAGARVAVLGAAYRGGVKETAFSGVFPVVQQLRDAGARVAVHDPLFSDDELAGHGWAPYHLGTPVEAAVIQADHDEYRSLTAADLPGARAVLDGRGVISPRAFPGLPVLQLGRAASSASMASC
jgi:nucleotide sugar dehydrogenase